MCSQLGRVFVLCFTCFVLTVAERQGRKTNGKLQVAMTAHSGSMHIVGDASSSSTARAVPESCSDCPGECFVDGSKSGLANKCFKLPQKDPCVRAGGEFCEGKMSKEDQASFEAKVAAKQKQASKVVSASDCSGCQSGQCLSHGTCNAMPGVTAASFKTLDPVKLAELERACTENEGHWCDGSTPPQSPQSSDTKSSGATKSGVDAESSDDAKSSGNVKSSGATKSGVDVDAESSDDAKSSGNVKSSGAATSVDAKSIDDAKSSGAAQSSGAAKPSGDVTPSG